MNDYSKAVLDLVNDAIEESRPDWVEGVEWEDIQSIQHGGCASGAYMPAVTYYQATKTMAEHGDSVLDHINNAYGELPKPSDNESWSGMAVFYLSTSVELWASGFDLDELAQEFSDELEESEEN